MWSRSQSNGGVSSFQMGGGILGPPYLKRYCSIIELTLALDYNDCIKLRNEARVDAGPGKFWAALAQWRRIRGGGGASFPHNLAEGQKYVFAVTPHSSETK